jgi:hypothetical protein
MALGLGRNQSPSLLPVAVERGDPRLGVRMPLAESVATVQIGPTAASS